MIFDIEYSSDGKFLILERGYAGAEEIRVPVAFVDEIIERQLYSYSIERLVAFRRETCDAKTVRKVAIQDLVSEDLTGKIVTFFFRNWEDSELITSGSVTGVVEIEGRYSFVVSDEDDISNFNLDPNEEIMITERK